MTAKSERGALSPPSRTGGALKESGDDVGQGRQFIGYPRADRGSPTLSPPRAWTRFPASGGMKAGTISKFTNSGSGVGAPARNVVLNENHVRRFHALKCSEGSGRNAEQVGPETDHAYH